MQLGNLYKNLGVKLSGPLIITLLTLGVASSQEIFKEKILKILSHEKFSTEKDEKLNQRIKIILKNKKEKIKKMCRSRNLKSHFPFLSPLTIEEEKYFYFLIDDPSDEEFLNSEEIILKIVLLKKIERKKFII